jgi:hypothetical protein
MIAQYLDLSTGHLTEETFQLLQRLFQYSARPPQDLGWPALTVALYEHGLFITVPPIELADVAGQTFNLPSDLRKILWYAHCEEATLIRFDADGSVDPTLPFREW